MYAIHAAPQGTSGEPALLTHRELTSIEERARSLGGNYVNVAAAMTLAHHDVPALLAEVRWLRERLGETGAGGLTAC